MADNEKKQTEVVELQGKFNIDSASAYDFAQKAGLVNDALNNVKKSGDSAGKSVSNFGDGVLGKIGHHVSGMVDAIGLTLPHAFEAAAVATAVLDVSKQIAQIKEWDVAMTGSTLASQQWTQEQQANIEKLGWSSGIALGEAKKLYETVGQQWMISPEDIAKGAQAAQLLNAQFGIEATTSAELYGYAIRQQGQSADEAAHSLTVYALTAKEAGIVATQYTAAIAAYQQAHPVEAMNANMTSLAGFMKQWPTLGAGMFGEITAAPYSKNVLWQQMFGLSEDDVRRAPEQLIADATKYAQSAASKFQPGAERNMVMYNVLQSILGLDDESTKQLVEDVASGKNITSIAAKIKTAAATKVEQQAKQLETTPGATKAPGAMFGTWPWFQEWGSYAANIIGSSIMGGQQNIKRSEQAATQGFLKQPTPAQAALESGWKNIGSANPAPSIEGQLPTLPSKEQLRTALPTLPSIPAQSLAPATKSRLDININLTGPAANQADVQKIAVPYDPAQNVGVNLIRPGRSTVSFTGR